MTSANIFKNSSSLGVSRCKPAQSPKKQLVPTIIQFTVRGGTTDRWGQLYFRLRLTKKVTDKKSYLWKAYKVEFAVD